jgi:hypothetical protein
MNKLSNSGDAAKGYFYMPNSLHEIRKSANAQYYKA